MRRTGPRDANAASRMAFRRARRAGACDHGGRGGAHRAWASSSIASASQSITRRAKCWPRTCAWNRARPMDDKAIGEARRRGLEVARSTGLFSVVFNGDANQLTSLRAVSEKYPLRGRVMLSDEPFGAPQPSIGNPAARRSVAGLAAGGGARRGCGHRTSASAPAPSACRASSSRVRTRAPRSSSSRRA